MLLVLTAADDDAALWLAHAFRESGASCVVVSVEALSFARRFSHQVSVEGFTTRIELAGGEVVCSETLLGVVNRMSWPPSLAWGSAERTERDYVTAELHALTVSWLAALPCPVRNRPSPDSLAGPVLAPVVAAVEAAAAGLDCPALSLGTGSGRPPGPALRLAAIDAAGTAAQPRHVVCLDAGVTSDVVPVDVSEAITRFLLAVGLTESVVGLDFLVAGGRWWFAGLTPMPDLRLGGHRLVGRLLEVLSGEDRGSEGGGS